MSDKMILKHHKDCQFRWWIKPAKPVCDCYMSWINEELKELQKYREQDKKISENGDETN